MKRRKQDVSVRQEQNRFRSVLRNIELHEDDFASSDDSSSEDNRCHATRVALDPILELSYIGIVQPNAGYFLISPQLLIFT